jgi:hypothetical protein
LYKWNKWFRKVKIKWIFSSIRVEWWAVVPNGSSICHECTVPVVPCLFHCSFLFSFLLTQMNQGIIKFSLQFSRPICCRVLFSGCKIRRDWLWLVYLWREPPSLAKKRILTPKKEPWSVVWWKCTRQCYLGFEGYTTFG